eukprot:scaffold11308_cov59-Cylindrotheca_fusiformis.AAC.1
MLPVDRSIEVRSPSSHTQNVIHPRGQLPHINNGNIHICQPGGCTFVASNRLRQIKAVLKSNSRVPGYSAI